MHCSAGRYAQAVAPVSRLCVRPVNLVALSLPIPTQSPSCYTSLQSLISTDCKSARYSERVRLRFPRHALSLTLCCCGRGVLACKASSYDSDTLELDAPEIDNDLDSYQVGVRLGLAQPSSAPDLKLLVLLYASPNACRHSWEPSLM